MATKRVQIPGRQQSEDSGSKPLTIEFPTEQTFLPTREHARFVEFAEACSRYRYIGVCHGRPGVGKTRSAREFASFPNLQGYGVLGKLALSLAAEITRCQAIFYTVTVSNTPKMIDAVLGTNLTKMGHMSGSCHARALPAQPENHRTLPWTALFSQPTAQAQAVSTAASQERCR
ncbi:hypothetical protein FF80_01021 [Devosia sp. LC5]|jgi:hypothetical protein|uniref:AAA family ATPase n=1 Tax=Devosia sp. LC5 TaxID=1502724 RepID=UPI0004E39F49|nr:AAA family ATPase [Devosia sp. LC5]KFC70239.1 hypothetical protein FF80_01021 [Devosia sp. LC5]